MPYFFPSSLFHLFSTKQSWSHKAEPGEPHNIPSTLITDICVWATAKLWLSWKPQQGEFFPLLFLMLFNITQIILTFLSQEDWGSGQAFYYRIKHWLDIILWLQNINLFPSATWAANTWSCNPCLTQSKPPRLICWQPHVGHIVAEIQAECIRIILQKSELCILLDLSCSHVFKLIF